MTEHIIFSVTALVCIINSFKYLTLAFGNSITLPLGGTIFSLGNYYFLYPSVVYQVYFWSGGMFQ